MIRLLRALCALTLVAATVVAVLSSGTTQVEAIAVAALALLAETWLNDLHRQWFLDMLHDRETLAYLATREHAGDDGANERTEPS